MMYPQALPAWATRWLDEAEEMMLAEGWECPTPDRYSAMARFLEDSPLTKDEISSLRYVISPNL